MGEIRMEESLADSLGQAVDIAVKYATETVDLGIRVEKALDMAIGFGTTDGGHHKMWVIDQIVRILAGDRYDQIIKEACDGEDGPDTYEWDVGIAP